MKYKNAAGIIALAAFFFSASVSAQEQVGGQYYPTCGPTNGVAITIETDNHLRIEVHTAGLIADEAYRTDTQKFEGELPSMDVELCDAKMKNCKSLEGVLTAYKDDGDVIEAALEYFDGTETQGDSESIEGHVTYFTAQRDKAVPNPACW